MVERIGNKKNTAKSSNSISGLQKFGAGVNAASRNRATSTGSELKIIRAGKQVPPSSIIELKTCTKRSVGHFRWADAYRQVFLSQTSHLFLAVHNEGRFEKVIGRKLEGPEFRTVAEKAQVSFSRLSRALKAIQELVVKYGHCGRVSFVYREGRLQVFERTDKRSCLPEAYLSRFKA
ncbi:hypothetical protein AcW1_002502 [Taiwanofungus camphoratus]|nr:hypothetical protein AcV5_009839 [Antrodia cinnamomea]KAI0926535.1 hypothetical protein AcV7_005437 [Antrodia cinnamomea]KAI0943299.1 hypothetical protein AcW1_002502 [Antrodia cinnamomea]